MKVNLYLVDQATGAESFDSGPVDLEKCFDLLDANDEGEYVAVLAEIEYLGSGSLGGGAAPLLRIRPVQEYEERVRALEAKGLTRSDAQDVIDAEDLMAAEVARARRKS